jgi:hydrogenase maturation protease
VPRKSAVIGIGNTLRRDDGIGIIILESLLKFYKRQNLDYFSFDNTSLDLLGRIETYDAVLFIDGINAGLAVGELLISELKDIENILDNSLTSTHELNLKGILELCENLRIKARIYLAGVQVEDTSFGEDLSKALNNKKEDIIKKISAFIDTTLL